MPFGKRLLFANQWFFKPLILFFLKKSSTTRAMLRTTTAPVMIESGIQENVMPGTAELLVNFRILPGDSVDKVLAHVKRVIKDPSIKIDVCKNLIVEPPPVASITSTGFLTICKTIHQVFPHVPVAPGLMIATTDSKHYIKVSEDCYRFAPFTFSPEDMDRIHGTNERVSQESYVRAIQYYLQLMKNS